MGKYHLPDGETLVEDLQCLVVYTPNDPVYRQALWGAISQLTKFWMWEPDGSGGEHDAADSWDLAYAATLESFDMLQQLLDAVDDVEDLLRALQTIQNAGAPCCEHLAPANETHTYDDSAYPDTPPSTWGDGEPIADASDWEQLVCGAAHAYVDHLKGMAQQLDELVGAGAVVVGTVAGILGLLSGAGIILAVGYGSAAGVVTGLLAGATEAVFGDVPADIEAARQDIVCEIVHGSSSGLASAVEAAISTLAWDLFYSFVDYGSARNIMLEGSHGSEFLGVNRRTDCECAVPQCSDLVALPAGYSCFVVQMTNVTGKSDCGTPNAFTIHQFEQIGDEVFVDIEIDDTSGCASRGLFALHCEDGQGPIDGFLMYPTSPVTIIGEDNLARFFGGPAQAYHGSFSQQSMDDLDAGMPVGGTVQTSGALFDWMTNNYVRNGGSGDNLTDRIMYFSIENPTSGSTRMQFSFVPFAITS